METKKKPETLKKGHKARAKKAQEDRFNYEEHAKKMLKREKKEKLSGTTNKSIFMQMHEGTRTGEGSFNVALKELFYKADIVNKKKLVKAFPEFFGSSVPEFGVK